MPILGRLSAVFCSRADTGFRLPYYSKPIGKKQWKLSTRLRRANSGKICRVLEISVSGFYHWLKRPYAAKAVENERLKDRILQLFTEHRGMAGSPMITADLHDDPEFLNVSRNRVARLMREMNLKCRSIEKYVVTTDSKHTYPVAENLLNRDFNVTVPNMVWVTDISVLQQRIGV